MISYRTDRIASFNKSSLIDWDGYVSSVIFLSGCNWICPFCHNHELRGIKNNINERDILNELKKNKSLIDHVVICGGEPLFKSDVAGLLRKLKTYGFRIKLDTNGSCPALLEKILKNRLVDYIAMDIKTALIDKKYFLATGRGGQAVKVKRSISIIYKSAVEYEFRTTMVPGIVSVRNVIYNLNYIKKGSRYVIQQFRNNNVQDEKLHNTEPYTDSVLNELAEILRKKGMRSWLRNT